jgi:hypothetical protein
MRYVFGRGGVDHAIDQICVEAMALPNDSRSIVVERLVESIVTNVDPRVERLHVMEVKKRRDEIRQGKVKPVPGEKALAEVRAMVEE